MYQFDICTGDCREILQQIPDSSIDSCVTDPPYELKFMSKGWDGTGIAYNPEMWAEVLRVLKPGGYLLSFGAPRTFHRIACAIEDAGFELRDTIMWLYGSGFPKSHNIALGIDKSLGHANRGRAIPTASKYQASDIEEVNKLTSNPVGPYESKTPESKQWEGWGTALKPAYEPVIMARKPTKLTFAKNVLEHGVGGLNIDACRIETTDNLNGGAYAKNPTQSEDDAWRGGQRGKSDINSYKRGGAGEYEQPAGRWPANIIIDEEAGAILDEQSGFSKSSGVINRWDDGAKPFGGGAGHEYTSIPGVKDEGGASRFFYTPKANKKERGEGNDHPTVKPLALMQYLVRLVTPPGGIVLDPFTGSGSTGVAALREGFDFLGIEAEQEYVDIAFKRLNSAMEEINAAHASA